MYRTFMNDGKEYRLEYSLEAYMTKFVDHDGTYKTHVAPLVDLINEMNANENNEAANVTAAFNLPEVAVHAMYAGLLRWHGRGKRGDKTVITFDDASELCWEIMENNPDDEYLGSWSGLIKMCIEQIEEDGFFTKLGGQTTPEDKKPKTKKK